MRHDLTRKAPEVKFYQAKICWIQQLTALQTNHNVENVTEKNPKSRISFLFSSDEYLLPKL